LLLCFVADKKSKQPVKTDKREHKPQRPRAKELTHRGQELPFSYVSAFFREGEGEKREGRGTEMRG
jgi:hypothetical protein